MIYRYSSHIRDNAERAARVIIGVKGVEMMELNSKRFEPCCGSLSCLLACRWCYGLECATPRVYSVDVLMTRRKGTYIP